MTGADLRAAAANVAEYHDIPLSTLHSSGCGPTSQLWSFLRVAVGAATAMTVNDWLVWRGTKKDEDAQRRALGLPKATGPQLRGASQNADRWKSRLTTGVLPQTGFRMGEMNAKNGNLSALAIGRQSAR